MATRSEPELRYPQHTYDKHDERAEDSSQQQVDGE